MAKPEPETTLTISTADRYGAVAIGAGAGLVIGLLMPVVWGWVENLDAVPFHDVLKLIMSVDVVGVAIARPVVLALAGGAAMAVWAAAQPSLRISDEQIVVAEQGQERVIRRDQVAGAYLRGSKVVIDSTEGRRLFDAEIEGAKKDAGPAFRRHGYPWESRER